MPLDISDSADDVLTAQKNEESLWTKSAPASNLSFELNFVKRVQERCLLCPLTAQKVRFRRKKDINHSYVCYSRSRNRNVALWCASPTVKHTRQEASPVSCKYFVYARRKCTKSLKKLPPKPRRNHLASLHPSSHQNLSIGGKRSRPRFRGVARSWREKLIQMRE